MAEMSRQSSESSDSTVDELPSEKHDSLLDHLRNADAFGTAGSMAERDLESAGRSLTRADTAAWVTKHPSRIPDEGIDQFKDIGLTILAMRRKEKTYIVEFEGPDDPLNPLNWSISKRVWATVLLSLTTLCVTFASSIFSSATRAVAMEFSVSNEVATLGTSLFVAGFAVGPLVSRNQTTDN